MTSEPSETDSASAPVSGEAVVAEIILRNLAEVFDERDRNRRRAAIAELWAADGLFVDPMGRFTGHEALDGAIQTLHEHTVDYRFAAAGAPVAHARGGLLRWTYGPEDDESRVTGEDAFVVSDGRIVAIYAFVDNPDPALKGPEPTSPTE